jgi:hypothetical protein
LRPNAARPTNPEPSSISVAGSGTGETSLLFVPGTVSEVLTDVEEKLDLLTVVPGSSEGQPAIPKDTIIIQKNINNFFIFFLYIKKSNVKGRIIWCLYKAIYFVCQ